MDTRRGRTDIVKGRSVRSAGNVLTTLSCSASGIFAICCDLTRPTITRLARTFHSTRTRRRREPYIPLVAFCLRHFLADFIICMCEFDFRQAHRSHQPGIDGSARDSPERSTSPPANPQTSALAFIKEASLTSWRSGARDPRAVTRIARTDPAKVSSQGPALFEARRKSPTPTRTTPSAARLVSYSGV